MPYLLDGNNLIGLVRRTARPTEEDRQALVAELSRRLRATKARAVLYFDGPGGVRDGSLGPLSIRSPGGSADDAIVSAVERAAAPSECIVVTGDRALGRRVRDAGGQICSPADFFERFGSAAPAGEDRTGTDRVDVEDWMRWFEEEGRRPK